MSELHKYFHWLYYAKNKRGLFIFGSGAFFWLLLGITLPFGINITNLSRSALFFSLLPVGLLWVVIVYILDFITKTLKVEADKKLARDKVLWLIKLVFIIHTVFLLRGSLCDWQCVNLYEYLEVWFAFMMMFFIAYIPFSLHARSLFFQQMIKDLPTKDYDLVLTGSGTEKVSLKANELFYMKSDDNYIDLFTIDNQRITKQTIRATMGSIEEQLMEHSEFLRTHRSYIINVKYYASFTKAQHILILKSDAGNVEIPVSRKYGAAVERLFIRHK